MTWEETILHARKIDEFKQLIHDSYLNSDLKLNVERFSESLEFKETIELINNYTTEKNRKDKIKILDIGAGNGISTIAFALSNFSVSAIEPDSSETVGQGAINLLKKEYNLFEIEVYSSFAESLPFENERFDVVYARQAMHHAHNLNQFVAEASRVLKKDGLFVTCRDHVVNDDTQKQEFLKNHSLHKFYNGENAFSMDEYKNAFFNSGLKIEVELGPLDSVINYSPKTKSDIALEFNEIFKRKIGVQLPSNRLVDYILFLLFKWKTNNLYNNSGRLYTFISRKH